MDILIALVFFGVGLGLIRTDDLIASLGLIHEAQLQLRKCRRLFHESPFRSSSVRGAYAAYWAAAVTYVHPHPPRM
jgi:hypothetical protein